MKLLFVISHKPDIRYLKRFDALKGTFEISVIYWNKDANVVNFNYPGINTIEIHVSANKTNPLKRIPETLRFMSMAYNRVKKENPDCLYVGNLDMLMIAAKHKKKESKTKIVYEIADLHRLIIDKQTSFFKKIISFILKTSEKRLMKFVDLLVLTSMKFYDVYYASMFPKERAILMPNMPDQDVFEGFKKIEHDKFTIAFVGSIRYKEQLRMLIKAAEITNVDVLFAGGDNEGDDFEKECLRHKNIKFLGEFNYREQIKDIYSKVDCIYAVYDADMANVRVALPNKLYESIMLEIPIIVAKNTYLSDLVCEMGIGYDVCHKNVDDLVDLLDRIKEKSTDYLSKIENCKIHRKEQNLIKYNNELIKRIGMLENV